MRAVGTAEVVEMLVAKGGCDFLDLDVPLLKESPRVFHFDAAKMRERTLAGFIGEEPVESRLGNTKVVAESPNRFTAFGMLAHPVESQSNPPRGGYFFLGRLEKAKQENLHLSLATLQPDGAGFVLTQNLVTTHVVKHGPKRPLSSGDFVNCNGVCRQLGEIRMERTLPHPEEKLAVAIVALLPSERVILADENQLSWKKPSNPTVQDDRRAAFLNARADPAFVSAGRDSLLVEVAAAPCQIEQRKEGA